MANQYNTQRDGLSLASFTPITYTPHLMDMNIYNNVLSNMEEKHYKALQGRAEIAKQLRELNLNPGEDEYISNLAGKYQQKIDDAISADTGYAGNTVDAIFEVGKDIQENNVLWGKVKNSKLYDEAKAKVTKMYEDGKIDDKAYNRWLEQNQYFSVIKKEGETDNEAIINRENERKYENALELEKKGIFQPILTNPPKSLGKKEIGVVNWSSSYSPVEKVSMGDIFAEAMKFVSDEQGQYEKVYFMDANGNYTEDFSNSVDGYWYYKSGTGYQKLSEEKIAKAMNTAIEGNSKFRQSLRQEYDDEVWDYDKLSENDKKYYDNSNGLINDKGIKKNYTNYVNDKIIKIGNLKSYQYYKATKDFNNEASKNYALRRGVGDGLDINPDVDSFMGTTGISILHNTSQTIDQALSKRDNYKSMLDKYFAASGLNDTEITKLLNDDYITLEDKQYDAADYIEMLFNNNEIDYNTARELLKANVYNQNYKIWYNKMLTDATPEQVEAFNFFEDLATGNILNTDNEISKMFDEFDIDENSYITVDNYTDIDGAKKKYNVTELSDVISLIGAYGSDIELTLHANDGDVSLSTGRYPINTLGPLPGTLAEVSYATKIKYIYNNYKNKKDEIIKNKIGDKIDSVTLLGDESFTRMGVNKAYLDGLIDYQTYTALSKQSDDKIDAHLATAGWANMNVYFSEDGDTEGNYLRQITDSEERVEKKELYKKALNNGKIHKEATVNPVTGRPAIYVSVSPYDPHTGSDNGKYAKGFTMLIDDIEISAEAEKYVNDTDTQALVSYIENRAIDCDYAVAGTGISAIDGDSFNCSEEIPNRAKLKAISGCKILEEIYNAAKLRGIDLSNEKSKNRVDAAINEALDNLSIYYRFTPEDRMTAELQIRNTINDIMR